ncbi:MAG: MFS transporter, partial [Planctomycetaceae bacterium]
MNDADSAASPGSPSDPVRNVRIPRPLHGSVLILLALASSSAYLTRHCLAVANTTIQKELDLNSEQMGYVFSLFALGYMIFQIPGGVVGLRIGTRNALPLFSVLWSVITVWSSLVYSLVPLLASRLTFGLAQAGLVPNTAQVIKDWFPSRWQGSVSSMIGVAMSLGGAATFWLTGELMEIMHWRSVFQIYSLVGIGWAVAFWFVFRTRPEQHILVTRDPE